MRKYGTRTVVHKVDGSMPQEWFFPTFYTEVDAIADFGRWLDGQKQIGRDVKRTSKTSARVTGHRDDISYIDATVTWLDN